MIKCCINILTPHIYEKQAAQRGDVKMATSLLEIDNDPTSQLFLIHVKDADGYTPLHRAAYNGRTAMIHFLINR